MNIVTECFQAVTFQDYPLVMPDLISIMVWEKDPVGYPPYHAGGDSLSLEFHYY